MKILATLLALFALVAPALAQSTKTQLSTEVTTNFPDNTSGQITPSILRTTVNDFISSWQQAPRVNAQSGTTYTFVVGDYGFLVTFTNASAIAVALPQATGSFATWNATACNRGAGLVTITPSTSTINGAATFTLAQNQCSTIVSDSANYQTFARNVPPTTCAASNWVSAISSTVIPTCSQPAFTDISGTLANAKLANMAAATLKGNATSGSAAPSDIDINALTDIATPSPALDWLLIRNHTTGTLQKTNASELVAAISAGVTDLNSLVGSLTLANGDGMAAVTAVGTTVTVAVDSTVGRKSGSFTSGNLLCSNNTTGTYIDCGLAPISSATAGTVYSNNTASPAAPSFNNVLRIGNGSSSTPTYSFSAHSGSGMYYNTNAINFADDVVFGDLGTAYKKVTFYGSGNQSIGIKSSSNSAETSIFFVDANTVEWRVGSNITNANRFDIRDNTNSSGVWMPGAGSGATTWTFYSDARLKTNVQPLASVLDRLDNYRAVSFDWIKPLADGSTWHGTGVIAQELYRAFPEVVVRGSDGALTSDADAWGVQYDRLGFIALAGVKELRDQVRALQSRISVLEHKQ